MGLLDRFGFGKLKEGLSRTREGLLGKITRLVTTRSVIDDRTLDELEEILIAADVGAAATGEIIEAIRTRVRSERYENSGELTALVRDEIQRQFPMAIAPSASSTRSSPDAPTLSPSAPTALHSTGRPAGRDLPAKPYVILVVGINGVGKTTTIGKLAHLYVRDGKKVVIAAADTFRAAANEQLQIWADRARAMLVRQSQGADPAAVAFDAVASAISHGADVVIVDTAGRLHTRVNLMEELAKIKRVIQKRLPDAPHEVLLVLDASTGQNGLQQARQFDASVGVTGLVLTKLDGTAKGGIVLAVTREMRVPVRFIGVGEGLEDLQPFDAEAFVAALFGEEASGDA
jgi:fused signal recognition particle receptor